MAGVDAGKPDWLEVIGKALSFLCVQELSRSAPERVGSVLQKVDFLKSLGVPQKEAAVMVGSTANSVQVMASRKARENPRGKARKK